MNSPQYQGSVIAVCKKADPGLPKLPVNQIQLIENFGVEGDYHAGEFVRHRYLAKKDPSQPNMRQVLLIDSKILAEIAEQEIHLEPGMMGENIIVEGIGLMALPVGTQLEIGEALLEITEVRSPCFQLDEMCAGLLDSVRKQVTGKRTHNAGMMAIILRGGWVRPGDQVVLFTDKQ